MKKLAMTSLVNGSIVLGLALGPTLATRSVVKAAAGCTNTSLKGASAAVNGLITFQPPPQQIGAFYPVAVSGTLII